jgi:hypothetical protein
MTIVHNDDTSSYTDSQQECELNEQTDNFEIEQKEQCFISDDQSTDNTISELNRKSPNVMRPILKRNISDVTWDYNLNEKRSLTADVAQTGSNQVSVIPYVDDLSRCLSNDPTLVRQSVCSDNRTIQNVSFDEKTAEKLKFDTGEHYYASNNTLTGNHINAQNKNKLLDNMLVDNEVSFTVSAKQEDSSQPENQTAKSKLIKILSTICCTWDCLPCFTKIQVYSIFCFLISTKSLSVR